MIGANAAASGTWHRSSLRGAVYLAAGKPKEAGHQRPWLQGRIPAALAPALAGMSAITDCISR